MVFGKPLPGCSIQVNQRFTREGKPKFDKCPGFLKVLRYGDPGAEPGGEVRFVFAPMGAKTIGFPSFLGATRRGLGGSCESDFPFIDSLAFDDAPIPEALQLI